MTSRWLLLALSAIGLIGVVPVSFAELQGTARCPDVGGLPVCYLVLVGIVVCPRTGLVIPACFISLGLAIGILALLLRDNRPTAPSVP